MSDHWQRIERGLRRMLKIIPTIPLFRSPARNRELGRVVGLLIIALFVFYDPIWTILIVLLGAWYFGGEGT